MRGYAAGGFGLLVVGLAMAGAPAVAAGRDAEPASRPDDGTGERDAAQQAGPSKPDNMVEFYISNIETVCNGPKNPTMWTTREPVLVTYVRTYHWNNAQGAAPGKISMKHKDGTVYGPWQTTLTRRIKKGAPYETHSD